MPPRLPHFALLLLSVAPASAETLAGPVPASVERVVDSDTIAVSARIWLGHDVHVLVRVRGIDAPEIRSHCAEEKRRAALAARLVADVVLAGTVTLTAIEADKYGGRDLAGVMIAVGAARRYDGTVRDSWCAG